MKYRAYPEYKDSGYELLGQIPKGWKKLPLKYSISERVTDGPHETPEFIDDGIPFLSVDAIQNNEIVFDGCRFISEEANQRFSKKCSPRRGDVLLGKAASVGKVAYVHCDVRFNVWSPLAVIRPAATVTEGKYLFYCIQSPLLQAQCDLRSNSNTQKNLGMGDIGNLVFPSPSKEEQKLIIRFLDHETAKIDRLIEKQQQLIELLKEKRQAVISHAVTKGLDPNLKMKDSGVERLGQVPEHWQVTRLKYECTDIVDCLHSTPTYEVDGDFPAIRTADVYPGKLDIENARRVSKEVYVARNARLTPKTDDIIYSREGERYGMCALVPRDASVCLGQRVMLMRTKVTAPFLMWALNAEHTYRQAQQDVIGATSPHVNVDTIRNFVLAWPREEERERISLYIDKKVVQLDQLESIALRKIALLQERRTSLISAVVTGKIDVRHWRAAAQTAA